MPTYILSYPGQGTRAAYQEWLNLAEQLALAGGRILVLDPGPEAGDVGSVVHAAHLGALFPQPQSREPALFLLSPAAAAQAAALERAGLRVRVAEHPFEGQADLIALPRNRFIYTFQRTADGPALPPALRPLLPPGAQVLEVPLRPAVAHGNQALGLLTSAAGHATLLAHTGGLAEHGLAELARFAGDGVDTVPLEPDDAAGGATSSLVVRSHLFINPGLSSSLRGRLVRRGFQLTEVPVGHLLAAGPGRGPRALVNELAGYVLSDDAPSYGMRREALHGRVGQYAEASADSAT